MYIMQKNLQLHLNILPLFPKDYDSETLTFTFHHTGITGYLVSKDVTPTGKPGEFLHLFWEGAYWVVCEAMSFGSLMTREKIDNLLQGKSTEERNTEDAYF